MQILFLPPLGEFILDVITWSCLNLGIGFLSSRIPVDKFKIDAPFYQSFRWEKGGNFYEKKFHVRAWKRYILAGCKLYPDTFSLQKLPSMDAAYLTRWVQESIRAEFRHWMMVWPSFAFFLWSSKLGGWLMVVYATLSNFFPIVAQRYNRPRIRRYLEQIAHSSPVLQPASRKMKPAFQLAHIH